MSKPTAQAIGPTAEGDVTGAGGPSPARPGNVACTEPRGAPPGRRFGRGADGRALVDEDAWAQLYAEAYPRLLSYARRRLPSPEHARDAVAETMVRALAGFETWRGEGAGVIAWLYGILRHVVLDVRREAAREHPAWEDDLLLAEPAPAPEADEAVLLREEGERLREAFARLAPDEQEVLRLRVATDLTAEHVARLLGKRQGAVRMAQSRALAHLRRLFVADGHGFDWPGTVAGPAATGVHDRHLYREKSRPGHFSGRVRTRNP